MARDVLYGLDMNATNRNARRRNATARARWDVVLYRSLGSGKVIGTGYHRLVDAQAAALKLVPRLGEIVFVEANVDVKVGTYARIGGRWIANPTTIELAAATWEIGTMDPGYARHLWPSLATAVTARGGFWGCAYLTADGAAMAYSWTGQPAAWAWDTATDGDEAVARMVRPALALEVEPAVLAAA